MDGRKFDTITRALRVDRPRRSAFSLLVGGAPGMAGNPARQGRLTPAPLSSLVTRQRRYPPSTLAQVNLGVLGSGGQFPNQTQTDPMGQSAWALHVGAPQMFDDTWKQVPWASGPFREAHPEAGNGQV